MTIPGEGPPADSRPPPGAVPTGRGPAGVGPQAVQPAPDGPRPDGPEPVDAVPHGRRRLAGEEGAVDEESVGHAAAVYDPAGTAFTRFFTGRPHWRHNLSSRSGSSSS